MISVPGGSMPPTQGSKLSPAAVIGPGRVGLALALFLDRIGVEVTVGARSERGRERVEEAGLAVADPTEATRGAALVLLSVPDDELPALVTALAADGAFSADQIVIHTAGVDGPALLAPAAAAGAKVAACHPVQIFNDDLEGTLGRMPGTVWGVTGDQAGKEVVVALGGRPMDVPESGRVRYHAALVLAANGCAGLAATAADQLRAAGVLDPEARRRVEAGLQGHVEGQTEESHEGLELLRRLGRRARGRNQR